MTQKAWDEAVAKDKIKWDEIRNELISNQLDADLADRILKEIFDIGFSEGQNYVWYSRSGFGQFDDKKDSAVITTTSTSEGGTQHFEYQQDGTFKEITLT